LDQLHLLLLLLQRWQVHFTPVAFVLHLLLMLFLAAICTRKLHQLGGLHCLPLPVAVANPVALAGLHLNGFLVAWWAWFSGYPFSESCSIV